jgi:hypothetical protein
MLRTKKCLEFLPDLNPETRCACQGENDWKDCHNSYAQNAIACCPPANTIESHGFQTDAHAGERSSRRNRQSR